jgi:hypothetical protein
VDPSVSSAVLADGSTGRGAVLRGGQRSRRPPVAWPGRERGAGVDPALELAVERVRDDDAVPAGHDRRCHDARADAWTGPGTPLGTRNVDFAEAFAALDRICYDGTITFESFSSAVVSPALTRALCIWRETWDDGMELATSARRFVAEQRAASAA